mgnify:CR=1 FL=1
METVRGNPVHIMTGNGYDVLKFGGKFCQMTIHFWQVLAN